MLDSPISNGPHSDECPQMPAINDSDLTSYDAARLGYTISLTNSNHERQVRLYEVAISKGEANAAVWNNYGFSLACIRRPEEARIAFKRSIQFDSSLSQPFLHLAALDQACPKKCDESAIGLNALAALQRMPDEPIIRRLATLALQSLGRFNDEMVGSQITANRLLTLLIETRDIPLRQPISPYVDPNPEVVTGKLPITHRWKD